MGHLCRYPRLARWRGAPCRHRHEPARCFPGRSRSASTTRADAKPRDRFVAQPSRLRRRTRPPAHCQTAQPVSRIAHALFRNYGINPTPGRPNPMKLVVELTGRILQIRSVARDQTIGYGATWTARRNSRIAVVAAGYADGLLRSASASDERPGGSAIIAGNRCPIVGRISMDLMTVDISDLPDRAVHRGGVATLIGGELSIDDVAAAAGTIGYEVLTRLGARCHVVYRSA